MGAVGPQLVELRVRNLGVIDDVTVALGPGMTALTGETGAGKTLLVEALSLLLGARADPSVVRAGTDEAVVEGRFVVPARVSGRSPPAPDAGTPERGPHRRRLRPTTEPGKSRWPVRCPPAGRSRAWVDGRMATIGHAGRGGRRS